MSAAGSNLAIVSLGVSCQSAFQIEYHLAQMPELAGADVSSKLFEGFQKSGFPFDWRVQPPGSFLKQAMAREFFPLSPNELSPSRGGIPTSTPPLWNGMDCHFWHEFGTPHGYWDVFESWEETQSKYLHTVPKFLDLGSKRTIFVLSNSQNNIPLMAQMTGLDFSFNRHNITAVRNSLQSLFPGREIELIVVTTKEMSSPDRARWPAETYLIDQKHLGPDNVRGDYGEWSEIFRHYFANYNARKEALLREQETRELEMRVAVLTQELRESRKQVHQIRLEKRELQQRLRKASALLLNRQPSRGFFSQFLPSVKTGVASVAPTQPEPLLSRTIESAS